MKKDLPHKSKQKNAIVSIKWTLRQRIYWDKEEHFIKIKKIRIEWVIHLSSVWLAKREIWKGE